LVGLLVMSLPIAEAQPLAPHDPILVTQSTDWSCGAAALATALRSLGNAEVSEADVLAVINNENSANLSSARYLSYADLRRAADHWRVEALGARLSTATMASSPLPAIVRLQHDGRSHFSALMAVDGRPGRRLFRLADPTMGWLNLPEPTFTNLFVGPGGTGTALLLHSEAR
jgi:predicted double-glycine peptidase